MTKQLSNQFYGEPLSPQEQAEHLKKAQAVIEKEGFLMKRKLDEGQLTDALHHCSLLLNELRTSTLSPKLYYDLYMSAFDELKFLEWWLFEERDKRGKKLSELYETVQYASNVLPRLYLLITVGAAYIRSGEVSAHDVLRDLVEMCRGVQHPTRGLFVRNFLSEMMKDNLPDIDEKTVSGSVQDSIDFILINFTEMNKLWVRLQQGPIHEREQRENDRFVLRTLVGKNLARLSQLEGVDCTMYSTLVMQKILNQVVKCNDRIAQQYLMEILIQIFPDEYHLATLTPLLAAFSKLVPELEVRPILVALTDRLNSYSQANKSSVPTDVDIYLIFSNAIEEICSDRFVKLSDYLLLRSSLLKLSLTLYGSKYVNDVCMFCAKRTESNESEKEKCVKELLEILNIPIENGELSPVDVLALEHYVKLSTHLTYAKRKTLQCNTLRSLLSHRITVKTEVELGRILDFVGTLLHDSVDGDETDEEDTMNEQTLVSGMIHSVNSDATDRTLKMFTTLSSVFAKGGEKRMLYTFPALIFATLKLAHKIFSSAAEEKRAEQIKNVFKFVLSCVEKIAEFDSAVELSFRLYTQCALTASKCKAATETYEFITKAVFVFEEKIADSQARFNALTQLIASIRPLTALDTEEYTALVLSIVKHCNRVLKKADQARLISVATHMFWRESDIDGESFKEEQRVLECLQRSLKVSEQVSDVLLNVAIRIDILNRYLYFFDHHNKKVTGKYISGMVDLINTSFTKGTEDSDNIQTYFRNTLAYIQSKKKDPESAAQYKDV